MTFVKLRQVAGALALLTLLGSNAAWAQTKAALIRDVDRELAQPVDGTCKGTGSTASPFVYCTLYTVPAGKRLKVEMVSYLMIVSNSDSVSQLLVGKGSSSQGIQEGDSNVHGLTLPANYTIYNAGYGDRLLSGSNLVAIVIDEGQTLAVAMIYTGGTAYSQTFGFTGYLVDKN